MKIKINDITYSADIRHIHVDHTWGNREVKVLTLAMDAATAAALFVNEAPWSIVHGEPMPDPVSGEIIPAPETDMSEFCVAGPIVDNRDGTVTVKMGKPTDSELLAIIMGG